MSAILSPIRHIARGAYALVILQGLLTIVLAAVVWCLFSTREACSALVGGGICTVSNAYFARCAFSMTGARKAGQILTAFYRGEVGKLVITVVLIGMSLRFLPIMAAPFFVAFIVVQGTFWLSPMVFRRFGGKGY